MRKYLEARSAPAAVLMAPASQRGAAAFSLRLARRHPLVFLKLNTTLRVAPLWGSASLYREIFCSAELPEERVRAYQRRTQDESYRMYADLLFGLAEPKWTQPPPPTLVLMGESDRTFPPSSYTAIARGLGADLVALPGLPHAMALDECWQRAADTILAWLQPLGL